MVFYNVTKRTEYDLDERDFIDEMLMGDVWQYQEEDSQNLTDFFAIVKGTFGTNFKDFISEKSIIDGIVSGEYFTLFDNNFWLVEDLKAMLVEVLNYLNNH